MTDPANPDEAEPPLPVVAWDIRREGRAWTVDEAFDRFELTPEKFEMIGGRLFWSHRDRVLLLGLLLENLGIDEALTLGELEVWREAFWAREKDMKGGEHAE